MASGAALRSVCENHSSTTHHRQLSLWPHNVRGSVTSQAAQSSWPWVPRSEPDQPASQTGVCLQGAPRWSRLRGRPGCSQSKGPRVSSGSLRSCRVVGVSLAPPRPGSRDSRSPTPCNSFSGCILMFYPLLFTYPHIFCYLFIHSINQGLNFNFFLFYIRT